MTNKEKFLISNVGFHYEDLSLVRQMELNAIASKLNLSHEWIYLALSKDKLEDWEKWGFSLFNKPEFRQEIDNLLKSFDQLKEEDFKKEMRRKSSRGRQQAFVSKEEFMKVYNGIKEQGKVIVKAPDEEELGEYWTYGNALLPEYYYIADEYAAAAAAGKEIEEEEWTTFFLCFQEVKEIKI